MEDSNHFDASAETAEAPAADICDAGGMDGVEFTIESRAPDMDDGHWHEDSRTDGEKQPFSDEIMKYVDAITESDEAEKAPQRAAPEMPQRLVPRTAEEEEIEILKSVPSERGRERIRAIIGAKKAAEGRYQQNENLIEGIRDFVGRIGAEPLELAQNLEYTRLLKQGDEGSLRTALDMLEEQRDMICKRINESRPGVDLLSDFPDLKSAVERRELSPEHAARLARYQRQEETERKKARARDDYDRTNATFLADLEQTRHAITAYLNTRSGEADHAFRAARLYEHLSRPGVLEDMTKSLDSKRWFSQVRFMYDNIVVPRVSAPAPRQQPIRSRPMVQGALSSNPGATLMDKMSNILESMGI